MSATQGARVRGKLSDTYRAPTRVGGKAKQEAHLGEAATSVDRPSSAGEVPFSEVTALDPDKWITSHRARVLARFVTVQEMEEEFTRLGSPVKWTGVWARGRRWYRPDIEAWIAERRSSTVEPSPGVTVEYSTTETIVRIAHARLAAPPPGADG